MALGGVAAAGATWGWLLAEIHQRSASPTRAALFAGALLALAGLQVTVAVGATGLPVLVAAVTTGALARAGWWRFLDRRRRRRAGGSAAVSG